MTDTKILDGMMQILRRNPLDRARLGQLGLNEVPEGAPYGTARQRITVDDRPFWAGKEAVDLTGANKDYAEVIDLFHEDLSAPRIERPRIGSCPRIRREFDGTRWRDEAVCGGTVHAVETVMNGAVRVDGYCLRCGTQIHRAGLWHEKG